jgi:hypothetical protein
MTTETKARELWCPMVRLLSQGGDHVGYNRMHMMSAIDESSCRCVGSKCAMWLWKESNGDEGFCGLAGRPLW